MPDIKQGKPDNLTIISVTETEIKIAWAWNADTHSFFDLPKRFIIFNRSLSTPSQTKVGSFNEQKDFEFTISELTKSTDYEFGVGADYLNSDNEKNLSVVRLTTTAFNFASTLPVVTKETSVAPPLIEQIFSFPKLLRNNSSIHVFWHAFDKYEHYNLSYFEKETPPENAVQVDFKSKQNDHFIEGFFIPNSKYLISMQGCQGGEFTHSLCSIFSNQIEVTMPPSIKNLRTFLGSDFSRGLRSILLEFNKRSILDLLRK